MNLKLQDTYEGSLEFLNQLSPYKTYQIIVAEALRLLQSDYGTILIRFNGELKRVYSSCPGLENIQVSKNGRTIKAFKTREPFTVPVKSEKDIHPHMYPLGIKSIIFIPLSYKQKNIGVLNILSRSPKNLSKQDRLLLKLFGSMASLAIYKADQYKRAEESIRARDMFIAVASHELRTPLTTITVYGQLLLSKISKGIMPDLEWVNELYSQITSLNKLTIELLQVSSIKKGKLQFVVDRVSIKAVIKKAAVTFSAAFPKHKLKIVDALGENNDMVKGDYYKLLQAFINILNNAGKFSPYKSTVTVSLKQENGLLVVVVHNGGEVISKEDMPNIFKGFYKGRKNNKEGMGLGLFLVKEIIEKTRGKISVFSQSGFGTTISVSLPRLKV